MSVTIPLDKFGGTPRSQIHEPDHFRDHDEVRLEVGSFYIYGRLRVVTHDIGRSRNNVVLATTAGFWDRYHRHAALRKEKGPKFYDSSPMYGCLYMRVPHFIECLSSDQYGMGISESGILSKARYTIHKIGASYRLVMIPKTATLKCGKFLDIDQLSEKSLKHCFHGPGVEVKPTANLADL